MNFPLFAQDDMAHVLVVDRDADGDTIGISQSQLLGAGIRLAAQIGADQRLLNLCADRTNFLIGLIASLLTKSVMLLPVSRHDEDLAQAQARHGAALTLVDKVDAAGQIGVSEMRSGTASDQPNPSFPADQTLAIAFTSGSTGTPQAHEKSWGALSFTARSLAERFALTAQQTVVGTVPVQHMYGLEMTAMVPLQSGARVLGPSLFYPKDIEAYSEQAEQPILVTTPIHLRALVARQDRKTRLQLKQIISATAPLAPKLASASVAKFACPVREIYGCTEAGSIATRETLKTDIWQTLEDIEVLTEVPATLRVPFIQHDVELGDQIKLQGAGFQLLGRNEDTINVAGKRFSLARLNQVLLAFTDVEDGVVFSVPGSVHGRPAALVVTHLTPRHLARLMAQHVDPTFVPRPIHIVPAVPRNATGKVLHNEVVAIHQTKMNSAGVEGSQPL